MGKIQNTNTKRIKIKALMLLATAVVFLPGSAVASLASEESDVRAVVQQVFQQLQSRNYGSVYDSLPSSSRTRMTRDGFIRALGRAQDRYVLDRINIGAVRVAGNIAVADTELYGRVSSPFPAEGKIVVQQYLVREGGKWRVATGDTGTINKFLKTNPAFARKFPIRQPKVFVKQGDQWIEFNPKR
ncbi:MAG TPA: hypothetical protein VMS31_14120 [Pyrinomonadaceae bacterium]|nr:hypothetical protein [Pyrinomonadaceae bacterium]